MVLPSLYTGLLLSLRGMRWAMSPNTCLQMVRSEWGHMTGQLVSGVLSSLLLPMLMESFMNQATVALKEILQVPQRQPLSHTKPLAGNSVPKHSTSHPQLSFYFGASRTQQSRRCICPRKVRWGVRRPAMYATQAHSKQHGEN